MDLDTAFVATLCRDGREAVRQAIDKGVDIADIVGLAGIAYRFVLDYVKQYDDVPTPLAVEGSTGVKLPNPPQDTASYYVDAVLKRRLHSVIVEQVDETMSHLKALDPHKAAEVYAQGLQNIRNTGVATSKTISLPSLGPQFLEHYEKLENGYTGVLTPWPSVNEATLGFWPGDFVLYVARLGIGKCAESKSLLTDPDTGLQRTVEEVYESNEVVSIVSWSAERGVHAQPITAKVDTGRKECLRFKLGTGRHVSVTPEHPFLTAGGWKRADELKSGASVAIPARTPFPLKPVSVPMEEPTALALLLAEGSYTGNHTGFSSSDNGVIKLAEGVAEHYGVDLKWRGGVDYDFVRRESYGPNNVLSLLRANGMDGKKAVEKTIPDRVFTYGPDALAWFLTVFWMCDGHVTDNGAEIVLGSEKMLCQLQSLLLRFGVQSRVSPKPTKYNGEIREAWRLRVLASSYETLHMVLGLWGNRRLNLSRLANKDRNPNVGFPRVSEEFAEEVKTLARSQSGRWSGGKLKEVGERLGWSSPFMVKSLFGKNNTLLLNRFRVLCEVYGVEAKYRWLWASDLFWDTVEGVEPIGEQKVYDLTVSPTECFVANDILVHNTWTLTLIADHAWAVQKKRVLFATTEMTQEKIVQRWVGVHFKLPYTQLTHGRLGAFAKQKMVDGLNLLENEEGLYIIGGDFDFRIESLEAAIEDCEPDIVLLDGAYLLKSEGERRSDRAANSYDELKRCAKRNHIPLVASTQFNREVKVGKLNSAAAEKIALSDNAGWNADLAYGLIQTPDMKKDRRLIQRPLKFREGDAEDIECWWDFETMNFDELPKGPTAALTGAGAGGSSGTSGGTSGAPGVGSAPAGGASGSTQPDPDPYGTGLLDFGTDDDDSVPF
jgi:intein/homing endonuclease